jgi:hypothetical protein
VWPSGWLQERFGANASTPVNAAMGPENLRRFCEVDAAGRSMLDRSFEKLGPLPA